MYCNNFILSFDNLWIVYYFRLLALKALNSRLVDSGKETPRVPNTLDPERRDTVIISIGDSEQSAQISSSDAVISNKTT